MATFFIAIIYFTFIGLGLPDSLLGASWSVMRIGLDAPLEAAGFISMVTAGCTVISSLLCVKLVGKFGTGRLTAVSVLVTALALTGTSFSNHYAWTVLMAVPLGLGAGCIDAALNNFVALHYSARHMNWLHCFWGLGASSGPLVLSLFLARQNNWRGGYLVVSIFLFAVAVLVFAALPLWKKQEALNAPPVVSKEAQRRNVFLIKGVLPSILIFLVYCAAEWCVGLWGSSFLVEIKGLSVVDGARGAALFFAGITLGRFLAGVVSAKLGSKELIRTGLCVTLLGAVILFLPVPYYGLMAALLLIGLGCAPIFPAFIHQTPIRFGKDQSQKIVSLQMAFAYMGNTFFPTILGLVAARFSLVILPFFIILCVAGMFVLSEYVNRVVAAPST